MRHASSSTTSQRGAVRSSPSEPRSQQSARTPRRQQEEQDDPQSPQIPSAYEIGNLERKLLHLVLFSEAQRLPLGSIETVKRKVLGESDKSRIDFKLLVSRSNIVLRSVFGMSIEIVTTGKAGGVENTSDSFAAAPSTSSTVGFSSKQARSLLVLQNNLDSNLRLRAGLISPSDVGYQKRALMALIIGLLYLNGGVASDDELFQLLKKVGVHMGLSHHQLNVSSEDLLQEAALRGLIERRKISRGGLLSGSVGGDADDDAANIRGVGGNPPMENAIGARALIEFKLDVILEAMAKVMGAEPETEQSKKMIASMKTLNSLKSGRSDEAS